MKKIMPLVSIITVFILSLFYLHQKVLIYVEAYRLHSNYNCQNELLAERDHLQYNFSKNLTLAKVNKWAQSRDFMPVGEEKVLALNTEKNYAKGKKAVSAGVFDSFAEGTLISPVAFANEE